jgi:hypothetical protein
MSSVPLQHLVSLVSIIYLLLARIPTAIEDRFLDRTHLLLKGAVFFTLHSSAMVLIIIARSLRRLRESNGEELVEEVPTLEVVRDVAHKMFRYWIFEERLAPSRRHRTRPMVARRNGQRRHSALAHLLWPRLRATHFNTIGGTRLATARAGAQTRHLDSAAELIASELFRLALEIQTGRVQCHPIHLFVVVVAPTIVIGA